MIFRMAPPDRLPAALEKGGWSEAVGFSSAARRRPGHRCASTDRWSLVPATPLKMTSSIGGLEVLCWSAVASRDLDVVTEFAKLSGQGLCAMDEKVWLGFNAFFDVVNSLMKNLPDQAA